MKPVTTKRPPTCAVTNHRSGAPRNCISTFGSRTAANREFLGDGGDDGIGHRRGPDLAAEDAPNGEDDVRGLAAQRAGPERRRARVDAERGDVRVAFDLRGGAT